MISTTIIAIIAGLFLATLSNWLYDLAREHGVYKDNPTLKNVVPIIAFAISKLIDQGILIGKTPARITIAATWILLAAATVYVFLAKRPSRLSPRTTLFRFDRTTRIITTAAFAITTALANRCLYHQLTSATVTMLVADFEGPEPNHYRATETINSRLREAAQPYEYIQIIALGYPIAEAEGSKLARATAANYDCVLGRGRSFSANIMDV